MNHECCRGVLRNISHVNDDSHVISDDTHVYIAGRLHVRHQGDGPLAAGDVESGMYVI